MKVGVEWRGAKGGEMGGISNIVNDLKKMNPSGSTIGKQLFKKFLHILTLSSHLEIIDVGLNNFF